MTAARPLLAVSLLALGACATSLPPTPELRHVSPAWTEGAELAAAGVEDRWWLAFGDPVLDGLVAQADLGDDLAIAQARLDEARAQLRSARTRLRPEITAEASAETSRVDDLEQDEQQGLAAFSWSPDLNGAGAARARAAEATLAAEASRAAAVRQATRATAVRLYITVRESQARAAAAERSVTALVESLDLTEIRQRAGLVSGLDPVAARSQLAAARAEPLRAREAEDTARLGLEALLGLSAGALKGTLGERAAVPTPAADRLMSTPVEVLARRPDLLAAERDLAAAGFEAAAARRDFWPTVSLSAALGGQVVDPETPFSTSGGLIQASAGLAAPVFSFGRLEGARDAADARRLQAALSYRQAATEALAEVEQALVARHGAEGRRVALQTAVEAGRDRLALARSRYRGGLTPLIDVLTAETSLSEAELALATAEGDGARAGVELATAMGLGAGPSVR